MNFNPYQIADGVFYVGVNDRQKALFENMIPLPNGVSYNSYLIVDEKVVLIDTVEAGYSEQFLRQIKEAAGGRPVDYVIIDHMEPDHSSSLSALIREFPEIRIVGNSKTIGMIEGYYGITEGFHEVADGDTLAIGKRLLQFYFTPMVHWPEVMMTYNVTDKILFSADAFGCFGTLDGAVMDVQLLLDKYWNEMYRYYANIIGKYGSAVQQAFKKLSNLSIEMIASTHGPVWTGERLSKVMGIYDQLSRYEGQEGVVVVYGSMYGHTEAMAEAVARGVIEGGMTNVVLHDVSKSHSADILADIFKYSGLVIGAPTYCNGLYPEIAALLDKIAVRSVKNRVFGAFGSFTWAGTTIKNLSAFAEKMGWNLVGTVEQKQALSAENYKALLVLGKSMCLSIKQLTKN